MKLFMKAPAKINLSLDVLHKRPDGYHEVKMVMTTVDLADRIELIEGTSDQIVLTSQHQFVPNDERNLAFRAAKLLKERFSIQEGVHIVLHKRIPVAAGLAGGSSDAAAVLRGLNRLWKLKLSLSELAELGAEIGSDVSFCVHGGTALATGRGEVITPLPPPPSCWVVLAKPVIGVSTGDVYGKLQIDRIKHPDVEGMMDALYRQDYDQICALLGNVLEPVTMSMYPQVALIKEQMQRFGADAVLMSGSGPTVYALVQHESRMHRLYNGLRGFCDQVYTIRMDGEPHLT
ncbi:4-(cytidine 5'-diphospho)-2-C-methyl-D-erythritol kinase [Bacillaceae bacterium SIJ1]|uniref:4-(cytidine 5'-diphospho)-2-C-methyl-D-erythritol kinase n=1 Tax=Litoribacterium kuwaitense TaxID=1398745 RepID=UPI0013EE118C|nr:4-(cytidine 5'-diphospho)-2-C-methyl-D-erythritol kinase [Litoribacterium kuwaitense]NGP45796.1 4-(cytidine 5'-diphospho)-2-C-methyl-D-erythritol kinase [Litoribacterium kuwaitense]